MNGHHSELKCFTKFDGEQGKCTDTIVELKCCTKLDVEQVKCTNTIEDIKCCTQEKSLSCHKKFIEANKLTTHLMIPMGRNELLVNEEILAICSFTKTYVDTHWREVFCM